MTRIINFLVENWAGLVAAGAVIYMFFLGIKGFLGLPAEKQSNKAKEWLIWACIEAEKKLQSGTGQLKMREVWNLFCANPTFAPIARLISFEVFEKLLTDALKQAKAMLVTNPALANYVYGDNAREEIKKLKEQLEV